MNYFCTYFDINYLPRALCMLHSLEEHCSLSRLYTLCLDEASYQRVQDLAHPNVIPVSLAELEYADKELASASGNRSLLEYYYTCGPAFIVYLLKTHPEIEMLTYIDADIYFFSNPEVVFSELAGSSIGITVHHFYHSSPEGRFNVGWITFRRDKNGIACVKWWRERCIEWCYERFEEGKYADQKYLDEWPNRFSGVKIIENHGVNVAPWNISDYRIDYDGNHVTIDGVPLVFFHYHGFKEITPWLYNTNLGLTLRFPSRILKHSVFLPYIQCLKQFSQGNHSTKSIRRKHLRHPAIQFIRTVLRNFIGILFRQYIIVYKDKVY